MKKVLSVILMFALILVMFAGCGKGKKDGGAVSKKDPVSTQSQSNNNNASQDVTANEPEEQPEDEPEKSSDDEEKGNISNPLRKDLPGAESYKDVLAAFKEFGYVYNTKEEGKDATWFSFHYVSLGTEKIDGEDAEHIKITNVEKGETKEYEGWYNAEGDCVKYKDSKGEKTGMDASFAGGGLGMLTGLYTNRVELGLMIIEEDGSVDDFMYTMKGKRSAKESVDLGTGSVDIELYDVEDKITHFDRVFGISKVNGTELYTVIETVNKEKDAMDGLRVTHAVPR